MFPFKANNIACVHTQGVKGEATEPTEQPATVLESEIKSMILLLFVRLFG